MGPDVLLSQMQTQRQQRARGGEAATSWEKQESCDATHLSHDQKATTGKHKVTFHRVNRTLFFCFWNLMVVQFRSAASLGGTGVA